MNQTYTKELVVLAADKNAESAISRVLTRQESLAIRPVGAEVFVHPNRDAGCFREAHSFMRQFTNHYQHAIVIMDFEGCGSRNLIPEQVETRIEHELQVSGWNQRAAAIVIAPELEAWVWNTSRRLEELIQWNDSLDICTWLREHGLLANGEIKPRRPKEALESVLRVARKPRTSALFKQLAQTVSLHNCTDRAFLKLKTTIQRWFPKPGKGR